MSDIRATTISALNGTDPITLTKQSAAKAWAFVNGTGTAAITNSFNASSLTDNSTGDYTTTWTNAFDAWNTQSCVSDASYTQNIGGPYIASSYYNTSDHVSNRRVRTVKGSSQNDCEGLSIAIHGDLA